MQSTSECQSSCSQKFKKHKTLTLNFTWKQRRPKISKTILKSKRTARGSSVLNFELHYRDTVVKPAWHWHKSSGIELEAHIEAYSSAGPGF